MSKVCISCQQVKDLDEFYAHPGTADGRAGVCKDCHKARMKARRLNNPAVQAYDRDRARRPENVARRRIVGRQWRIDHPEAYKAQTAVGNAIRDGRLQKGDQCEEDGCERTDVHAHHDDYSKPLEVRWMCPLHHHRHHAEEGDCHGDHA